MISHINDKICTWIFGGNGVHLYISTAVIGILIFLPLFIFGNKTLTGCVDGYEYKIIETRSTSWSEKQIVLGERLLERVDGVYVYKACVPEVAK